MLKVDAGQQRLYVAVLGELVTSTIRSRVEQGSRHVEHSIRMRVDPGICA